MFSILIPTWNNLDYLKLCVESIRRHSRFTHEILVHVNEGSDGTVEWLESSGIRYSRSPRNVGIPIALNGLARMASKDWILYLNDDMVCCPDWDGALLDAARRAPDDLGFYSSRLIEPTASGNPVVLTQDFGRTAASFDEDALLRGYRSGPTDDLHGLASQPTLVNRRWWDGVGGYSVELSPGMSTDLDFLMKLWVVGCRRYTVVGESRVYHFACRSTGRIVKNHGGATFAMKWGVTENEFKRWMSRSGRPPEEGEAATPFSRQLRRFSRRAKRAWYALTGDYPLADLAHWKELSAVSGASTAAAAGAGRPGRPDSDLRKD